MSDTSEQAQRVDDAELDYQLQIPKVIEAAQADTIRANVSLRRMMTKEILPLFKVINKYVLSIVVLGFVADTVLIWKGSIQAEQRLINSEVIMALIGAATVQVGSIIFTISAYLFPKAKVNS